MSRLSKHIDKLKAERNEANAQNAKLIDSNVMVVAEIMFMQDLVANQNRANIDCKGLYCWLESLRGKLASEQVE